MGMPMNNKLRGGIILLQIILSNQNTFLSKSIF